MARLVLIRVAGIQDFIFATNRLRQNVGASELIHRIGTSFVLSAVALEVPAYAELAGDLERAYRHNGRSLSAREYVARLAAIARQHPLGAGVGAEVLAAASGHAVLLVDFAETGERIIERVTLDAIENAPGAVVRGIVDSVQLDLDRAGAHHAQERMADLRGVFESLQFDLPPAEARFQNLPIVALCATSGLPAEHRDDDGLLSTQTLVTRQEAHAGWRRVKAAVGDAPGELGNALAMHVGRLDKMGLNWHGVVHADGNGFGRMFQHLADNLPDDAATARDYCAFYREVSLAVEMAGVAALRDALKVFEPRSAGLSGDERPFLPIVPLVFGGDDLTVICDGERAVHFAAVYLTAFEQATDVLLPRMKHAKAFGGCAGVAIVKPHHPFHRAYDLAEALTRNAKMVKSRLGDRASALDFQVVYQDAASDLERLRSQWEAKDHTLHARPYVVSGAARIDAGTLPAALAWAGRRHIEKLERAIEALEGGPDSGLPRSQQHALRSALFEGPAVTRARHTLIRHRYKVDWKAFDDAGTGLFFDDDSMRRTRLIDALELIDIGEKFTDPKPVLPAQPAGATA